MIYGTSAFSVYVQQMYEKKRKQNETKRKEENGRKRIL